MSVRQGKGLWTSREVLYLEILLLYLEILWNCLSLIQRLWTSLGLLVKLFANFDRRQVKEKELLAKTQKEIEMVKNTVFNPHTGDCHMHTISQTRRYWVRIEGSHTEAPYCDFNDKTCPDSNKNCMDCERNIY